MPFDFDAKRLGATAVRRDVEQLTGWLRECRASWFVDANYRSGGCHVIVWLAPGETLRAEQIVPVMRTLATRLPTLDISNVFSAAQGCITVPGSACREGGNRALLASLGDALATYVVRSEPGLTARLTALVGDIAYQPPSTPAASKARVRCGGENSARLQSNLTGQKLPAAVRAFAEEGRMPADMRWTSRSEARQSVLVHAALRGMTLAAVRDRMAGTSTDTPWLGLQRAYARYRSGADRALERDWDNALSWAIVHAEKLQCSGHSETRRHTGGHRPAAASAPIRARAQKKWLACATEWVDMVWPGQSYRWTVLAVLQGLAYASVVAGEIVNDTPVVAVGGRSLSLHTGLMPETTIWEVLAHLRDLPGSPITRIRSGAGTRADEYALVTARQPYDLDTAVTPTTPDRIRVEPIHDAYTVLGLHTRRIYELVTHTGLSRVSDIIAAAQVGQRAAYDIIAALCRAGLIFRSRRGMLAPGSLTLDDVAAAHGLHDERRSRIERIVAERKAWRRWLEERHAPFRTPDTGYRPHAAVDATMPTWGEFEDVEALWAALIAQGPPDDPFPQHAEPSHVALAV